MVRVDPEESDALLDLPGVSTVVMRGRPTHNWVRARGDDVATDDGLAVWIERGLGVIRRLPPRS
nr:hypothetical protein [Patulibacter minatonensis]